MILNEGRKVTPYNFDNNHSSGKKMPDWQEYKFYPPQNRLPYPSVYSKMAQAGWIYPDGSGKSHRVGLYHGDQSGHLVIYCNMRIMQIDFSVLDTTSYSFFIEDEFCEIHLIKQKDGRFTYEFKINKEVDTPRNQERKKVRLIENRQLMVFLGVMVLFVIALLGFNYWHRKRSLADTLLARGMVGDLDPKEMQLLQRSGKTSVATFFLQSEKALYTFNTERQERVSGQLSGGSSGAITLPNGFPLYDRNEFEILYLPDDPSIHRINFNAPQLSTIRAYFLAALEKENSTHPDQAEAYNRCLVETVYQLNDWQALAIIYQQTDTVSTGSYYHPQQYRRLVNDPEVVKALRTRCGDPIRK